MNLYDLEHVADILKWIFLIFPHFALSHSLTNINLIIQMEELCQIQCDMLPGCTTKEDMCSLLLDCCGNIIVFLNYNFIFL